MFSAGSWVIPAKAGIQTPAHNVDSRFRGNDLETAAKSRAAMFSTEHVESQPCEVLY
jgi:hypothetical protein